MTSTLVNPQRIEDRFSTLFELQDGTMLNGNNASLKKIRQDAIASFSALGLPTRKSEAWKYTPIEKRFSTEHSIYLESRPSSLRPEDIHPLLIPGLDAHLVVMLNGQFQPALSNIGPRDEAVTIIDLKTASDQNEEQLLDHLTRHADFREDPLVALNTAFLRDGLYIHLPAKMRLSRPVYVLHLFDSDGRSVVQPRSVIVADPESEATIVERYYSLNDENHIINAVSEWSVDRQAAIRHFQIQDLGTTSTSVFHQYVHQETHSNFSTHTSTLRGGFIRNNLLIAPDAEECESHLLGFVLGKGTMHVDNHTLVDHRKPHCFSNELYKNILDDRSSGVFNGKVLVRPDAQKTNAYQSNKSITLTDKAKMYSKPELEIYADDVKCSHGATTGQLDAEALFYLQSRGLNRKQARSILLLAFARDVIDAIEIEPLREYIDARVADHL